ncbi:hypothetical protein EC80566_2754 [Escherichia coli 8.0566]|nr:hypothetical protein EC80566_2754 [Escherichia coli 8.0566]EKK44127.1 hypothetical protein EC80569_2766 [Escherichia coli 8.0569]
MITLDPRQHWWRTHKNETLFACKTMHHECTLRKMTLSAFLEN